MTNDLVAENEELKRLLWRTFVSFQMDVLSVVPKDHTKFLDFVSEQIKEPPFVKGSESYRICQLCGKV